MNAERGPERAKPRSALPLRKKLVYSAIATLLCLWLLEGAARIIEVWKPPLPVDYDGGFLPESRVFVPRDAGWYATAESKTGFFHEQRFRVPKPPGTLRVAAVGGSNVHMAYGHLLVMAQRLKERYGSRFTDVDVVDAGGLSYGSRRMVSVAREVLDYEPDVVIAYEAHNEFEEVDQLELSNVERASLQRTISHSAFVRVVRDFRLRRKLDELCAERDRRQAEIPIAHVARAWSHRFTQEDIAIRMKAFEENYGRIIDECRARNVPIILGTVPSNLVRPAFDDDVSIRAYQGVWDLFKASRFEEAASLGRVTLAKCTGRHQSSDLENDILRKLAADRGVPLADVEAAVVAAEPHHVPGEKLFRDHCHLTDSGFLVLVGAFQPEIERVIPTR